MQKVWQKIKSLPIINRLNQFRFMPIIWWTLLLAIFPYLMTLCRVPIVWRMLIVYLPVNCCISYYLGLQIKQLKLPEYWLLLLPVIFDLVMLLHYARYNLWLGLIYLIFEVFGMLRKQLYR